MLKTVTCQSYLQFPLLIIAIEKKYSEKIMSVKIKIKPVLGKEKPHSNPLAQEQKEKKDQTDNLKDSSPILDKMEQFFKESKPTKKEKKLDETFLEYRDRPVGNISSLEDEKNDDQSIEEWIGEVCRKVMSTSFHHFISENMTFDQAKIYCCQEILRNISQYADKYQVNSKYFKNIDKIMKEKIMPYLALKYPLNNSQNANRSLSKIIKEINNMEILSIDFFFNSDIVLKYRQNGNYNDIIMRVINDIVSLADRPSPVYNESSDGEDDFEELTNFKDFDNYITKLFQKVYDPIWMKEKVRSSLKSSISIQQENPTREPVHIEELQKYKDKVQQYTQYQIGRKIPENITTFSSEQIRSGHLIIKSPEILRIMTKWCQQLWNKFDNQNYFIDKTQGITMLNSKHINILYEWLRMALKKLLKDEKGKIEKYMQNVENSIYEQQYKILQSELLSSQAPFMSRYERVCGKFSTKVVNNLKNCVILYLNRLIHGLMTVSDTLFRTKMKGMPSWTAPPNLLSFKIGDLLRCRIASREKEIVRLYQELMVISQVNPDKLKVIRVKDRLKSGTNDLLINVRYNNQFTSQIQLKVLSKLSQSRFESCSFKFAHFIYELQRSQFGPISEICSIWFSHDLRTKLFQQLVLQENLNTTQKNLKYSCLLFDTKHVFQSIQNEPFICSKCGKSYSTDNFVLTHKKCKTCSYYKCCFCQINDEQHTQILEELVADQSVRQNLNPEKCDTIPKIGICIKIQNNTEGQMNMFKTIETQQKLYLFFVRTDGSFELKKELKTDKERKKFLKENIVLEYTGEQPESFQALTLKEALQSYIQPLYVRNCYKLEKESLSLNQMGGISFDPQKIRKLLRQPRQSKKTIKQLQVSSQSLVDLNFIPSDFVNLELINVNFNQLTNIQALAKFKKLKTIYCFNNNLTQYPSVLCKLPLRVLSFGQNKIKQLPEEFEQYKYLEIIRLDTNGIEDFPMVITKLTNLRQLYANNNSLSELPEQLSKLTKLRHLKLDHNKLSELPLSLKSLTLLEILDVSYNQLTEIKVEFKKMKRLKELDLSKNKLIAVPSSLNQCKDLTKLELFDNQIEKIDFNDIFLPHLTDLNLQNCKIKELFYISNIKNITTLKLNNNQIEELPEDICQLKALKHLDVQKNKLTTLPKNIHQLFNLQNLNVSSNEKITLPSSFSKLKLLTLKINRCSLTSFPNVITQLKLLKVLDISINQLKSLPKAIKDLKSIEIFMFGSNVIPSFPNQLMQLKNLKRMTFRQRCPFGINNILNAFLRLQSPSLDISKCIIDSLPERIQLNSQVESIVLHSNCLETIPYTFCNFTSLKTLDLSINRLISISDAIFQLKQLTSLNVAHNMLKSLPNKFNKLQNLSTLDISCNKIELIPDSLKSIYKKEFKFIYLGNKIMKLPLWMNAKDYASSSIQLSSQFLDKMPKGISKSALKLSIQEKDQNQSSEKSKLVQFPSEVLSLVKTEELNLKDNQIKSIPEEIKKLTNLKYLYLSRNEVQSLPAELCQLPLCRLQIEDNPLKKVPESMAKLDKLHLRISPSVLPTLKQNECLQFVKPRTLLFNDMKLESLPQQVQELTFIKHLDLSSNLFTTIPECVFSLKELLILNISDQPIENIPSLIEELTNLAQLMATNCKLTQLPYSLGKLSKLWRLYLSNNKIKQFPQQMQSLKNLQRFDMNNNGLTQFPLFLLQLPKCTKIYLNDNQIKVIPEELQNHGVRELGLSNNKIEVIPNIFNIMRLKPEALFLSGNPVTEVQDYDGLKGKLSKASLKDLQKFAISKK